MIHAFSVKLKPSIAKELLSRETLFKDSEALSTWPTSANAMYSATPVTEEGIKVSYSAENAVGRSQKAIQICKNFICFQKYFCELPDQKCKRVYLYMCSSCGKFNCKDCKCNQKKQAAQNSNRNGRNVTRKAGNHRTYWNLSTNINIIERDQDSHSLLLNSVKQVVNDSLSSLKQELTTIIMNEGKICKTKFLVCLPITALPS